MLGLWITAAAMAAVSSDDRWIGNSNLSVGLHQDGSFVNPDLELGILWDPDGADGPIPMTGDLVRVGYHWDGWAWSYAGDGGYGGGFQAGPHNDDWSAMTWTDKSVNSALSVLTSEIDLGDVEVALHSIALSRQDLVIQDFTFTATEDLSALYVGRTIDADQDEWLTESRVTENLSGEGWATSSSLYDERSVAIGGTVIDGDYGEGGVCSWCNSTSEMAEDSWEDSTGDHQINVVVEVGSLAEGESVAVRFVYAFEVGAETARDAALDALDLMDIDDDGLSEAEGDCNDLDPDVFPGATELADDKDNDCDDSIDEDTLEADDDGDGYSEAEGDCDDSDPDVYPGADPVGGVSNADCDGIAEGDTDDEDDEPDDDPDDDPTEESSDDTGTESGEGPDEDPDSESSDDTDEEDGDEPADSSGGNDGDSPGSSSSNTADGLTFEGEKHASCSQSGNPTATWWWLIGLISIARRQRGAQ